MSKCLSKEHFEHPKNLIKKRKFFLIFLLVLFISIGFVSASGFTDWLKSFFRITGHQTELSQCTLNSPIPSSGCSCEYTDYYEGYCCGGSGGGYHSASSCVTNCEQGAIPSSPGCYCGRGSSEGPILETSGYCCWDSYSNEPCATTKEPCVDSDGGINANVKGTASGNYRGATIRNYMTYVDECSPVDSTRRQLNEGYCDSDGWLSSYGYNCGSVGCADGVCLSQPSTSCSSDSDCATSSVTWAGATFCDGTGLKLMQYKQSPTCQSGECVFTTSIQAVKEDCSASGKVCEFTTSGGGVYACVTGTPSGQCALNAKITTRCTCGSGVYGGAYNTWSGYDSGYCCGSGSNIYQTSGLCPTSSSSSSSTSSSGGAGGGGGGGGSSGGSGTGGGGGGATVVFGRPSTGIEPSETEAAQSEAAGMKEEIFIVNEEESKIITPNGVVNSEVPLDVDETDGKVYAIMAEGTKREIVISPTDAEKIVEENEKTNEIKETILREYKNEAVYEVKAVKEVKIINVIKSDMNIKANVDVKEGKVLNVKKPWWAPFARGK